MNKYIKKIFDIFKFFIIIYLISIIIGRFCIIPTSSLYPTIKPIEMVYCSHLTYKINIPLLNNFVYKKPNRGDVIAFKGPANKIYAKRIIGVPGDKIEYKNKQLYINNKLVEIEYIKTKKNNYNGQNVLIYIENINKKKHYIQHYENEKDNKEYSFIIPKNKYFLMGDNRDNSLDSRVFGFVDINNIYGKIKLIIFSYDNEKYKFRYKRFFKKII